MLGGEYDLEPRGSAFFLYTESTYSFRAFTKKCGIMLVLKGAMFCLIPCTAVLTTARYLTQSYVSFFANCALRVVEFDSIINSCIS